MNKSDESSVRQHRPRRGRWIELTIFLAGGVLVTYYRPFARLFGFEAFEARHSSYVLEYMIYVAIWAAGTAAYLYLFRRKEQPAEYGPLKDDLSRGRTKRMSLAARCGFLLVLLGLVSIGWFFPHRDDTRLLVVAVPLFLLFAAVELNCVLHPGESLLPDPTDELLMFFKARMLQVGYVTAILALVALYLSYLFAPTYVGLLLPVVLTICLLVPGFVYSQLDRRAAADG